MSLQAYKRDEVPLKSIKIGERFRKEYGDVDSLAESIKTYGLLAPIVVDRRLNLIAGGRRYEACSRAQLAQVPVIIKTLDGEIDLREIELIENIHRKDLEWQERAALEKRIHELSLSKNKNHTQRDTGTLLGHTPGTTNRRLQIAEALEIIPDLAKCKTEDDAFKMLKKAKERIVVTALRSKIENAQAFKWAKDHYRIGDALVEMEKLAKEKSIAGVDFLEVDPPYAVDLKNIKRSKEKGENNTKEYNEISEKEYPAFLERAAAAAFRILKQDRWAIWWFGQTWQYEVEDALTKAGFTVRRIPAIWTKGGSGQNNQPDSNLSNTYETFFACAKGNPLLHKPGRSNVFSYSPVPPADKIHPTERPLDLISDILDTFMFPGGVVCVPFLGSGTTLRAAYVSSRTGFGWDLSNEYKERFLARVAADLAEAAAG